MKKFLVAVVVLTCLLANLNCHRLKPPHETGDVWSDAIVFGSQTYIATCKCGEDLVALCIVETREGDYTDITFQPQGLCRPPDCEDCDDDPECKPGSTDPRCDP